MKTKPEKAISSTLWEKLSKIAVKQYEAGVRFKQPRMLQIQENEDLYNNKVKKAPKGRFNVPLPVMGGFVDTLMSKIDDAPSIEFGHENLADYDKAVKVTAAWKKDSSASSGRWNAKDRATKRTATTSGVGIFELYAESDPEYQSILGVIDPLDFYNEPLGGTWNEDHAFCGTDNVFRSETQLNDGVKAGYYDAEKVLQLVGTESSNDQKRVRELFQNRQNRMRQMGLDPNSFNFVGQKVFSLVKHEMEYKGRRYLVVFDYDTGIAIRVQTIRTAFGLSEDDPELYSFVCWHTHPDTFNFWSKAPADDIKPSADAINIIFNQALDNRQKINYGQRAVDGSIFPDLAQLEWRPDGLVQGDTKGGDRTLREGIYEFHTDEVGGTVDMINFMDSFVGTKTGITASSQGGAGEQPGDQAVGIYYGDMQQVADRLGLYNKNYSDAWTELGVRYTMGIKNHMTEGFLVKIMGEDGANWDEVNRNDATPETPFGIKPVGGQAEIRANQSKKLARIAILDKIMMNQQLSPKINPSWVIEQYLKSADYEDDDIQVAKDLTSDGDIYSLAEASKAIQQIMQGKKPKPYRSATTTFCQRILNYATDKVEDMAKYKELMDYVDICIPIAQENAQRKLMLSQSQNPMGMQPGMPQAPQPTTPGVPQGMPMPTDTPAGTQSQSAIASNQLTG